MHNRISIRSCPVQRNDIGEHNTIIYALRIYYAVLLVINRVSTIGFSVETNIDVYQKNTSRITTL